MVLTHWILWIFLFNPLTGEEIPVSAGPFESYKDCKETRPDVLALRFKLSKNGGKATYWNNTGITVCEEYPDSVYDRKENLKEEAKKWNF